jgi:hypothetical protein
MVRGTAIKSQTNITSGQKKLKSSESKPLNHHTLTQQVNYNSVQEVNGK